MNERREDARLTLGVIGLIVLLVAIVATALVESLRSRTARETDDIARHQDKELQVALMEADVILHADVREWDLARSDVPVHAVADGISPLWIVRFDVVKRIKGDFPFDEINVLTHSPFADLAVRKSGERFELALKRTTAAPRVLTPSEREAAAVVFANRDEVFNVTGHIQLSQ